MNDETRKLLTEFIGECWHELRENPAYLYDERACATICSCKKPVHDYADWKHDNRTFSTPGDAQVVKDKLVERGKWEEFFKWLYRSGKSDGNINVDDTGYPDLSPWGIDWLWSYTHDSAGNITGYRLCELAGEFVKKGDGR